MLDESLSRHAIGSNGSCRKHNGISVRTAKRTERFNLYLDVACAAGLFAVSSLVFYQLWLFIAPGLYCQEKRYALPFLLSTVGLFMARGLFGYKIVLPGIVSLLNRP